MDRRAFLGTVAGAITTLGLEGCAGGDNVRLPDLVIPLRLEEVVRIYFEDESGLLSQAALIGKRVVRIRGSRAQLDLQHLADRLADIPSPSAAAAALAGDIDAELAMAEVGPIDGWLLTPTEQRLCAAAWVVTR